jgi:hypothetical protein
MPHHIYTEDCPHCGTPGEYYNGERTEDCCPGAELDRIRRLVEKEDLEGLKRLLFDE